MQPGEANFEGEEVGHEPNSTASLWSRLCEAEIWQHCRRETDPLGGEADEKTDSAKMASQKKGVGVEKNHSASSLICSVSSSSGCVCVRTRVL